MGLKTTLRNTWLHPRHIGFVYIQPAIRQARPYVHGRLLDVGCGFRPYETVLRDLVTAYIGLDWPTDLDKPPMDVAGDALCLPFHDRTFDTILATEVLEHMPSPDAFFGEMVRVLTEDGTLILSVPFLEPLHEEPRDYYRFTPYSLRLLLERHGFSVERLWARGGWWSVTLGSFVNQALYDWANPYNNSGERQYNFLRTLLVLPFCALAQWLGYMLDRLARQPSKYTLGYVLVAIRKRAYSAT